MAEFIIPPPPKRDEETQLAEFKLPEPTTPEQAVQFKLPEPTTKEGSLLGSVSEEELKKDPEFIKAAKSIYEWNEGRTIGFKTDKPRKLNSDEEYANYALRYMGWFNYNIPKMTKEVADLYHDATDQQKIDFVTLMDKYDQKQISLAGTGRLAAGLLLDPSTYVGIGTFGAGLAGREAAKAAAKQSVREMVKTGIKKGVGYGAAEGAIYATADNALRQSARIQSGQQEGFDFGQAGKAAAIGSGLGGVIGGTIGGIAGKVKAKKTTTADVTGTADEFVVPEVKEAKIEIAPVETNIKSQIDDELIKIGVDPEKVGGSPKMSARQGISPENFGKQPEKYGILNGSVGFDIDYTNPSVTASKIKEFFIKNDSLNNFKLDEYTPTPTRKALPESLKIPAKPKERKALNYLKGRIGKDYYESSELRTALSGDPKGQIPLWLKARKDTSPGNVINNVDQIFEALAEDNFYPGLTPGDDIPATIYDDLAENKLHPEDAGELSIYNQARKEVDENKKLLQEYNINPRGMSEDELTKTLDDIRSDRIPPPYVRDDVPFQLYEEAIQQTDQPTLGTVDFQPDTTLALNQKIIDVGTQIIDELEIPRNPKVLISDQLKEAILLADSNKVYRDKLADVLSRNNITVNQLSELFRESITDSAKRMAQLSVIKQSLQKIGKDVGEIAKEEGFYSDLITQYTDVIRSLDNIRRGLMVSQIATAMRNNTAQIGRVLLNTLVQAFDGALNQTFNPIRRAFGAKEQMVDHTKSFRLFMNLTKDKAKAKDLTEFLTKYYVNEGDKLFTKYASEVADSSRAKVFKGAQKAVDGLNFLNRMQEFYYRRGMFATSIQNALADRGIDINKIGIGDDLLDYISADDVAKAVDDALYFTYAKTPDNTFLKKFVEISNSIPFITTGVLPFARFMANAIEFQFKHSPVGFGLLLRPKEIKKIASGDTTALSQAIVGTTLLLATIEAKRKSTSEHKWYELETSTGKTVDMRPYFPLTPYMFVADVITRIESGRNWGDAKDILQALTGAQFRAGAALAFVNNMLNDLSGLDTTEKINKYMVDFTSNVLSGFTAPLRMFNDFIDLQQEFRRPEITGEFFPDLGNQLLMSVPFARDRFPEVESPTRAATPGRPETIQIPFTEQQFPATIARQLTGITVIEEKNLAEREFDRLGFKTRDILPYSGNPIVDQTRAKYMGPYVEKVIGKLVSEEGYLNLSNAKKELALRTALKVIRSSANDYIKENRINELDFQKAAFNRQPKYIKKLFGEEGITWETLRTDLLE
ncbi:MAG: hypothetical protein O3A58_02525 [Proteobacteria bacterium]|nr:hypothetical protein [Pseudomonadota bacterium]